MTEAKTLWMEFEDYLAPLMGMRPGEHALYSHLLRHTHLEGRPGVVFHAEDLGRGVGLGAHAVRLQLHALARKGCVRVKPWKKGFAIEVLTPAEAVRGIRVKSWMAALEHTKSVIKHRPVRERILRRERRRCFYCGVRLHVKQRKNVWFDHVVPLSRGGLPGEHNMVACCESCNRGKGTGAAGAFLRRLLEGGRITSGAYRAQVERLMKLGNGEGEKGKVESRTQKAEGRK